MTRSRFIPKDKESHISIGNCTSSSKSRMSGLIPKVSTRLATKRELIDIENHGMETEGDFNVVNTLYRRSGAPRYKSIGYSESDIRGKKMSEREIPNRVVSLSKIAVNLFLGDYTHTINYYANYDYIINLSGIVLPKYVKTKTFNVSIEDERFIPTAKFLEAYKQFEEILIKCLGEISEPKILVHCNKGVNRSPSMII